MSFDVVTHDWEFYEDGKIIKPISVAMVSDLGEYYAVFEDAQYWSHKTKWLVDNVYPYIASDLVQKNTNVVKSKQTIATELVEFIRYHKNPSLWAWYGAYDYVVMAQTLGGPMMNLPDGVPTFTNDIKTLDMFSNSPALGVINENPHHALFDARYDMKLYKAFMERMS